MNPGKRIDPIAAVNRDRGRRNFDYQLDERTQRPNVIDGPTAVTISAPIESAISFPDSTRKAAPMK